MKALEKKLEKEKKNIKKKAAEERKEIEERKNLAEEEREKLLAELTSKEADQEQARVK